MKAKLRSALLGAALCTALAAGGCVYRTDLAQGNFVEQEAVDRLRQGMTADQVRFIMGSPMLIDPFDSSRWYYVHFLREGWSDPEIRNLILLFQGNRLIAIEGDFKQPPEFLQGMPRLSRDLTAENTADTADGTQSGTDNAAKTTTPGAVSPAGAPPAGAPPGGSPPAAAPGTTPAS